LHPGNGAIVRRLETNAGDARKNRFIQAREEPFLKCNPGQHGKVGFGNGKGKIGAARLAPFNDLLTTHSNHP
jgi:hypothetical protein